MKLSFSLTSKPSSKPNPKSSQNKVNDEDQPDRDTNKHQYVTEFDPSKTLTDSQSKKFIIPPKENEWAPLKKMKNLEHPFRSDGQNLQFEVESPTVAETVDSNISYGLNLRQSTIKNDADAEPDSNGADGSGDEQPRSAPIESVMLQKLKDDLKRLPDDTGFEEFNDMPVEGFGAALLAGYGWYEGRGVGKNAKGDVKVVQYEKRTAKEGLGFVSDMHTEKDKTRDMHTKKDKKADLKKQKEKEGNNGNGFFIGKDVRIVGGRNAGLKGRIVDLLGGGDFILLKLLRSGEEVEMRLRNIAELGSKEEEDCLRKMKELKDENRSHRESKDEKLEEKRKGSKRSREEGSRGRRREEERTDQVSWLASHIRVRIISKDFKGGRLYLKKGEIVEVIGPTKCDVYMDESKELIQGVDQDLLETVVPRRGGPVLVLYGKHKGAYGNLVDRDMEKETGVIRDADSHALHNVRLEQIAEYVGDPSYIGY